jgi:ABC-type transporter Mla subunit MlaD
MRARTADTLIGLLVVSAIAVLVAALAVTRGWTERRVTLYMISPSVQDLKQDTPVYLQGLNIGEVASISPVVDSTAMGPPQFLVALRLRERFANGVPIRLPLGTRAEITAGAFLGAAAVALVAPKNDVGAALVPGDTIRATLQQGWTDVLKEVADTLRTQVSGILSDTRQVLQTLDRTASTTRTEIATTAPEVRATLAEVRAVMARLEPVLQQAEATMANADQQVGVLSDSLSHVMADTRTLLRSADSLSRTLTALSNDLSPDIRRTVTNLYVVSAKLEWFIDQISRRPHRLVTGVNQITRDSILRRDSVIQARLEAGGEAPR